MIGLKANCLLAPEGGFPRGCGLTLGAGQEVKDLKRMFLKQKVPPTLARVLEHSVNAQMLERSYSSNM